MPTSAIGYRIRERRRALGATQADMARRAGISPSYLNLIEANKRAVGGALLARLARELELDVDALTGAVERRLSDDLRELPADPLFRQLELDPAFADEVVARHPDWARAVLRVYRAYLDNNDTVAMLSDRLGRDPLLAEAVHRMLTHITAIRSSAEIVGEIENLDDSARRRFERTIYTESTLLSEAAQHLVSHFDQGEATHRSLSAAEEVDDFIIAHRNWFPDLEAAGEDLRRELDARGGPLEGAVERYLEQRHGITVGAIGDNRRDVDLRNQCRFETEDRRLLFAPGALSTTRRFQALRVAAEQAFGTLLEDVGTDPRLSSPEARTRARRALSSYIAAAALLPYHAFLDDAERCRYDIEVLRQRYEAGYEQVCHRLVTLRNPDAEGIPFAFLRADPSGHVSKRFPLYGFPLPRYGHACPLWNVFAAFQVPFRVVRQLAEFESGRRFLMVSRTVTKRSTAFNDRPPIFSIMLACDALHADRTVYADGIDPGADGAAVPVGPTCRLCTRNGCQHRQAPAISLAAGGGFNGDGVAGRLDA